MADEGESTSLNYATPQPRRSPSGRVILVVAVFAALVGVVLVGLLVVA